MHICVALHLVELSIKNMKKIIKKLFNKNKKVVEETKRKEPKKKLPAVDYDGMGDFSRFGRP
jgi:ribonuclease HIII